jgi:hypothetical protein
MDPWRRLSTLSRVAVLVLALASLGCDFIKNLSHPDGLSIQRFAVSPEEIAPGAATTLTWDVQGAESVLIDNGVGAVSASGSRQLQPGWTTTYTLTAKGGTSSASATVQVVVRSPGPAPGSSPSPSPSPGPGPTDGLCGTVAGSAGNCRLTLTRPLDLPSGQCVELNLVTVDQACPVAFSTTRSVRFDVTAHTTMNLTWRRAAESSDVMIPASGTISKNGTTTVLLTDVVLDSSVTVEILGSNGTSVELVPLRFRLQHY